MIVDIFARSDALLGEGPLWHPDRQSLFWLDILNQRLYEKSFPSENKQMDHTWELPEMASALATDKYDTNRIWMVTDRSFGYFSLESYSYKALIKLNLSPGFRANDGGISPDGEFWFGTMERSPSGLNGDIYSISPQGELTKHLQHIGIPNTFCWSDSGSRFYLSDSYEQKMYIFSSENNELNGEGSLFLDISETESTPDGGAFDQEGNLWNSQWDGSRVACYNAAGILTNLVDLPIPRPTSCCFGGPDYCHLFITSASEGLTQEDMVKSPYSGSVFVVELDVAGQTIPPFDMDIQKC